MAVAEIRAMDMIAFAAPSLLAAAPKSASFSAAYVIGAVFGVLMARRLFGATDRTPGRIILGAICAIPVGLFVNGFIKGFKEGIDKAKTRSLTATAEAPQAVATAMAAPVVSGPPQVAVQKVTGKSLPFTIQIPAGWKIERDTDTYDFVAGNGTSCVSLKAKRADGGSTANFSNAARKRIKEGATGVEFTDHEPIQIDGRKWLQFTATGKVKQISRAYQCYAYSGSEGSFQIIAWTPQDAWNRESATLGQFIFSFRFPSEIALANTPRESAKTEKGK